MQAASSELLYVPIYSTLNFLSCFTFCWLQASHTWWYHLYSAVCNLHASYLSLYCCFNLTNRHNAIKKNATLQGKRYQKTTWSRPKSSLRICPNRGQGVYLTRNIVLIDIYQLSFWKEHLGWRVDSRNTKTLKTCSFWVCVTICCHQVVSLYLTLEVGLNKQDWKPWFEEWS